MSINKAAFEEILARDGLSDAIWYLTAHENMSQQEANDFISKNNFVLNTKEDENFPVYYCEEHGELSSPNRCAFAHRNETWYKRILNAINVYHFFPKDDNGF